MIACLHASSSNQQWMASCICHRFVTYRQNKLYIACRFLLVAHTEYMKSGRKQDRTQCMMLANLLKFSSDRCYLLLYVDILWLVTWKIINQLHQCM